jgi:hypothetical protein
VIELAVVVMAGPGADLVEAVHDLHEATTDWRRGGRALAARMLSRLLTGIHKDGINKLALRVVGRSGIADLEHMPRLFGLGLKYVVRTRECLELSVVSSALNPPGLQGAD